jgi:hypothetical protein
MTFSVEGTTGVSDDTGKTVREILIGKKGSIKDARLVPGSPSWDELMDVPWEEIVQRAKARGSRL